MRAFLSFLGFGRSARLSRMVNRARNVVRRAYAPAYGFSPVGPVRIRLYAGRPLTWTYAGTRRDTETVPPYRGGWGIPAVLPSAGTLWVYDAACRAARFRPGR